MPRPTRSSRGARRGWRSALRRSPPMLNPRTTAAPLAPSEPEVGRHAVQARLIHCMLAASFLPLLVSAFGPILGWEFNWVAIHWIAGIVMTLAILFHLGRALLSLDFWSMMVDRTDLRNLWRGL